VGPDKAKTVYRWPLPVEAREGLCGECAVVRASSRPYPALPVRATVASRRTTLTVARLRLTKELPMRASKRSRLVERGACSGSRRVMQLKCGLLASACLTSLLTA